MKKVNKMGHLTAAVEINDPGLNLSFSSETFFSQSIEINWLLGWKNAFLQSTKAKSAPL